MAHKTITISEEAYERLENLKRGKESFTDVILRMTKVKQRKSSLIKWLEEKENLSELADQIESVFDNRDNVALRY